MKDSIKPYFVKSTGIKPKNTMETCPHCNQKLRNIATGFGNERLKCECPETRIIKPLGFGN